MTRDSSPTDALQALDQALRTLLPPAYQDTYEQVQPVSMGSAGLKYGPDGLVAWDEIWGSFCDLAMAGGPPHRGTLLEPASPAAIAAEPDACARVTDELCRGLMLVTGLPARRSDTPGWVTLICLSETMADWLVRAVTMENVSARSAAAMVELPAGPHFRVAKEIKNVITSVAKTCHYWMGHIERPQRQAIANLFAVLSREAPLLTPVTLGDAVNDASMQRTNDGAGAAYVRAADGAIAALTGLAARRQQDGWLGIECVSVGQAVWLMRALVTRNVLARREETRLLVPVNPALDPDGARIAGEVAAVWRLAVARGRG